MKKKSKVIMILSIIFISIIYSLAIGVKPAKATCVDVAKDPCFCGLFDIPIGQDTAITTWFALYHNRTKDELDLLRTLNLMVDTCNLIDNYREGLVCTDTNMQSGFNTMDGCVYVKYIEYSGYTIPFGFIRAVNIGDTIEILDFDPRNIEILNHVKSLNSNFCITKNIIYSYDSLKHDISLKLELENHVKACELEHFFWKMNFNNFNIPLMFSITTNSVSKQNGRDSFWMRQQNDELHIRNDFNSGITEIEIYNLLGICQIRSEMNSSTNVLDISRLPRGLYIVRIGSQISKFMRE